MTEDEPHPLTRMITINRPSFWIFFVACVVLYVYNRSQDTSEADVVRYAKYGNYVCLAAFTGLFLTLLADMIKKPQASRLFTIFCYMFEIVSLAWLGTLIIIR